MGETAYNMVFIVGATITAFLCLLLLLKKPKAQPDYVLMVWLGVMALHQLLAYCDNSGFALRHPHLLALSFPFPMFSGVFLYLYARSMTSGQGMSAKMVLPHVLPPLLLIGLSVPFYSLPAAEKIAVFENNGEGYEIYEITRRALYSISGTVYVIWTLLLVRRHQRSIEDQFSNTEHKNLRWLQYLSVGLGIIWFFVIFSNDLAIFSSVVLLVLFMGFYGIHQLPIFHAAELENKTPAGANDEAGGVSFSDNEPVRYAKSGLKTEDIERIAQQLSELMAQKALYKNPELTLAELAKSMGIHPNHLSQAINDSEKRSFYHYINTLRVEEFLRMAALPANRKFTLLALAFDCGFNSKTTFNKYFKHCTGKTPSEYFQKSNY